MTHGTDRDTPDEGADRDAADVPAGSRAAGPVEPGSTTERPVVPVDDATTATPDGDEATDDDTTTATTDDDTTAPDEATTDGATTARSVTADRGATDDGPPVPPAGPVQRARPLAPAASEPMASWPSWDDVAVTAPPAGPTTGDAPAPAPAPPAAEGTRASGTPTAAPAAPAPGTADAATPRRADSAEVSATAEPAPDATPAEAPGRDDAVRGAAEQPTGADPSRVAAPTTTRVAGPDPTPGALPPLSLGGLSALAFAGLNAASVGVAAHALPQSTLPTPDDAAPDASDAAPAEKDDTSAGAAVEDPAPAASAPGATAPTAAGSVDTAPAGTDPAGTDPADTAPAVTAPAVTAPAVTAPADSAAPATAPADDPAAADDTTADDTAADDTAADDTAPDDGAAGATPGAVGAGAGVVGAAALAAGATARDEIATDRTDARRAQAAPAAPAGDATAVTPVVPPTRGVDETTVLPPARSGDAVPAPTRTSALGAASGSRAAGGGRDGGDGAEPLDDDADGSPLAVFEAEDGTRRWPRVAAIAGGALALVLVLYVVASYALADRVPRGASVAGVDIGSMSSGEAEQALTDGLADRTSSRVPVIAQDVQAEVDPAAAGLVLDTDATVARLTGVNLAQPVRLWRHLVGVGEQRPVTQVDEDELDVALTQLTSSLVLAPVDGTVVFADGAAFATPAADGWSLDTDGAAQVLADGWLTALRPLELPTAPVAPAVSQEETDRALAALAQPLAAAPVTVQVADRQAQLDVATLTANAAVVPVDGTLQLQLDGAALMEAVLAEVPDLLTTAADARFEFQGGNPVIVPGTPGTTLDPAALAASVAAAATGGTDRVAPVDLVQSDPAESTAALEALGVKEVVSEFSTPLTSEPRRTSNIANGLGKITGTLVRPGETFSLTEALGPVDAAHGFVEAGAIVNGEHKDAWGGGLSQVSTTTFNAGYFAGYEDVEHTPHSEWFQRYPEGREATIFTGVLDMKWKNNTPYGALVQGYVADGRAHVRIWSTKHFTVETEKSGRSGVVAPTTVYSQSRTCEPQSAGNPGFSVSNTRRVFLDGELVDTETDTWRYKPQNRVICGTAPAPGAAPTP